MEQQAPTEVFEAPNEIPNKDFQILILWFYNFIQILLRNYVKLWMENHFISALTMAVTKWEVKEFPPKSGVKNI
jgi:hypothetical protein